MDEVRASTKVTPPLTLHTPALDECPRWSCLRDPEPYDLLMGRISSTPATGGDVERASAIFLRLLGVIGRPASAAVMVGALTLAARARSALPHPLRAISNLSRSAARTTLTADLGVGLAQRT